MSKEQNLSPPLSSPVDNAVTSLPQLPDDFLSFQPQASTHNPIDVNHVLANNSLNNIKQEQQQGSYRRGGNYNRRREYNNSYNDNNTRSYHGQKRGNHGAGRSGRGGWYGGQQRRGEWKNYTHKVIY